MLLKLWHISQLLQRRSMVAIFDRSDFLLQWPFSDCTSLWFSNINDYFFSYLHVLLGSGDHAHLPVSQTTCRTRHKKCLKHKTKVLKNSIEKQRLNRPRPISWQLPGDSCKLLQLSNDRKQQCNSVQAPASTPSSI